MINKITHNITTIVAIAAMIIGGMVQFHHHLANGNVCVVYDEFIKFRDNAEKIILLQSVEASNNERSSIPFAIDRKSNDLSLEIITHSALNFLSKDLSNGFFLMIEGGNSACV